MTTRTKVAKNQFLEFSMDSIRSPYVAEHHSKKTPILFEEIKNTIFEPHQENLYVDFHYEELIKEMLSQEGPTVSVGDVNNDGNEDIFIGAAQGFLAYVYLHLGNEKFVKSKNTLIAANKDQEDTTSSFIDVDGDGDLDLVVGSGGNNINQNKYINRLYFNDGKGNFTQKTILPKTSVLNNVSCIRASDYDNDGDLDLFIGSRSSVKVYGINPSHQLLQNDGKGNYKDVSEKIAYFLKNIGMITDAQWEDMNGDDKKDLVVTTDWGSPKIFKNTGQRLVHLPTSLDSLHGWWNTLAIADLNGDDKNDLILGNEGENNSYIPSSKEPMKLYINDFDKNSTIEQITTRTINGRSVPIPLKKELTAQIVSLKKQNIKYGEYAKKSIEELFTSAQLKNAIVKQTNIASSVIALQQDNGDYQIIKMPVDVQLSCINAIYIDTHSKTPQIILGGNNYDYKSQFGRLDSNHITVLESKDHHYIPIDKTQTGIWTSGEVKHIVPIKDKRGNTFIYMARNNISPKIFKRK